MRTMFVDLGGWRAGGRPRLMNGPVLHLVRPDHEGIAAIAPTKEIMSGEADR